MAKVHWEQGKDGKWSWDTPDGAGGSGFATRKEAQQAGYDHLLGKDKPKAAAKKDG